MESKTNRELVDALGEAMNDYLISNDPNKRAAYDRVVVRAVELGLYRQDVESIILDIDTIDDHVQACVLNAMEHDNAGDPGPWYIRFGKQEWECYRHLVSLLEVLGGDEESLTGWGFPTDGTEIDF